MSFLDTQLSSNRPGVSNPYLDSLLKFLVEKHGTASDYLGVFAADRVPLSIKNGQYFIANTDQATDPGEHFIVLFKEKGNLQYFDPLANPYFLYPDMKKKLKKAPRLTNPNRPIQAVESQFCGYFCALFCCLRFMEPGALRLLTFRRKNLKKNDEICVKNLMTILRKKKKKKK